MDKLISIIIPNWNGKEFLKKCLDSIECIHYRNIEIIFVDNASSDGSCEFVESNYPSVKIIKSDKNLGFAEGCNIGFEKSCGDYILFLNNDTEVTPNFLSILVEDLKNRQNLAGIQPKILLMDDPSIIDSICGFMTSTGLLYHFGYGQSAKDPKYDKPIEIFSMKGVAMLFKRSILEKVGLFDPDFFAYFEETDLCHRIWLAGYKIAYNPKAIIYHKGQATAKKLPSAFVQFHSFKNRINSYIKNLDSPNLVKILPIHLLVCFVMSVAWPRYFIAIHKAIWWNISTFKKTLKKRKKIQGEIRKVKDKYFLPKLSRKVKFSYYFPYGFFRKIEKYDD